MTKIKICGLFLTEDIVLANRYHPDYIGFVFAKSHRQVSMEIARQLRALLIPDIQVVGVFVNHPIEQIEALVKAKIIDVVQLHGNENAKYIATLKTKIQVPIIKAIRVTSPKDLENIEYDVDYYLLDGREAGSGQTFDWSYIKKLDKPYFLAGGITINNIDEALHVNAYAIDVSSGVETEKKKDEYKVEELMRRVRDGNR